MTAQALPKTDELSKRMISFSNKKRKLTPFDIRKLKKDVESLKGQIDYFEYYDYLGQIACLERDKGSIVKYYENALRLAPDNYLTLNNYVVSLEKSGFFTEAITQAQVLVNKFPDDLKSIERLRYDNFFLCRFKDVQQLLNNTKIPANWVDYEIIIEALAIFNNAGLSDDEAQHLCELAYSVLESQNLYFSKAEIEIIVDCVCYTIYIDERIEKLFDINWELSGVFAEKLEDMRSDVLIFDYSSIDILEERQKYDRVI